MIMPAKMKNGRARSTKLPTPLTMVWASVIIGSRTGSVEIGEGTEQQRKSHRQPDQHRDEEQAEGQREGRLDRVSQGCQMSCVSTTKRTKTAKAAPDHEDSRPVLGEEAPDVVIASTTC